MSYQLYPRDLTDREWEYINPLIPSAKARRRNRKSEMRPIINAVFDLTRTGCSRRYLPGEDPPWPTADGYFRAWRIDGTWQRISGGDHEERLDEEDLGIDPEIAVLSAAVRASR